MDNAYTAGKQILSRYTYIFRGIEGLYVSLGIRGKHLAIPENMKMLICLSGILESYLQKNSSKK